MTYEWPGLCRCGCGEPLGIVSKATYWRLSTGQGNVGWKRGHRHRQSGNPRWRGGRSTTWSGYVMVTAPDHPNARPRTGYILEHRLVISQAIGRPLRSDEVVHHRNGIKTDNRLENLELVTRSAHRAHHGGPDGPRPPLTNPPTKRTCPTCGTTFLSRKSTHCSWDCMKRSQIGEHASNVRLTDAQIVEIKTIGTSIPQRKLAAQFTVSKTQIGRILRGESR